MSDIEFDEKEQVYCLICPQCLQPVQVPKDGVNCAIFRHAVYKDTLMQIPPHSTKEVCDELIKSDKVYGCCKPFFFDGKKVIKLDVYN